MSRARLTIKGKGLESLMAAAEQLRTRPVVKVGWLAAKEGRQGGHGEPISNPELAMMLHHGSRRIPPRPVLALAAQEDGRAWRKQLEGAASDVATGKKSVDQALSDVGARVVADVKRAFHGDLAPDSPATVASKDGAAPLIDTHQLQESVSAEVLK